MNDQKPPILPITDNDALAIRSQPALFCNKMYVTLGSVVKLTFAEQFAGGDPISRAAVALSMEDAIALKNLLSEMLRPIEKSLAQVQQKDGDVG